MTDWISLTRCPICGFAEKAVLQKPDDALQIDTPSSVRCPNCGNPARLITFPAFDIQTFERSRPGESIPDAMYDMMDDW
jgi:rubredoxin